MSRKEQREKEVEKEVVEFDFKDLLPFGMSLVVLTIGIAYGLSIQEDMQEDNCDYNYYGADCVSCPSPQTTFNSTGGECYNAANVTDTTAFISGSGGHAFNATTEGIVATSKIPEKIGTIVTIVIAAIIIGILFRYFMIRY